MNRYTKVIHCGSNFYAVAEEHIQKSIYGASKVCWTGEAIDRLAELENKIERGRLVEVVHGEWINKNYIIDGEEYKAVVCNLCEQNRVDGIGLANYCPNCGSKMDGKQIGG